MTTTKVGFQLASSLASKHLMDAEFIKGGYLTVNTIEERNALPIVTEETDGIVIHGSLCYCVEDSTFYQYNGNSWEEVNFGSGGGTAAVDFNMEAGDGEGSLTGNAIGGTTDVEEKDVSNKAFTKYSSAFGYNTIAGGKGYKFVYYDKTNLTYYFEDDVTQVIDGEQWAPGDIYSVQHGNNYDLWDTIKELKVENGTNTVTVRNSEYTYSYNSIIKVNRDVTQDFNITSGYQNIFRIPAKPKIGNIDMSCGTAFGIETKAVGSYSVAEGYNTLAHGKYSHAEGNSTKAAYAAHSEGQETEARGLRSHAEGYGTIATAQGQHVEGIYNIIDETENYAHIVGNGNYVTGARSNAHTLDWNGNAWFAGNIRIGGSSWDEGSELSLLPNYKRFNVFNYEHQDGIFDKISNQLTDINGNYVIKSDLGGNGAWTEQGLEFEIAPNKTLVLLEGYININSYLLSAWSGLNIKIKSAADTKLRIEIDPDHAKDDNNAELDVAERAFTINLSANLETIIKIYAEGDILKYSINNNSPIEVKNWYNDLPLKRIRIYYNAGESTATDIFQIVLNEINISDKTIEIEAVNGKIICFKGTLESLTNNYLDINNIYKDNETGELYQWNGEEFVSISNKVEISDEQIQQAIRVMAKETIDSWFTFTT